MRLVNIHTLQLHEFIEGRIPPYAILSHRWTDEELTFKELAKGRADTNKKGYQKLLGACRIAAGYGVDYVWIDTCCIDKRSSAELSESINSMYAWYRDAKVCLAYLEDVSTGPGLDEMFRKSIWFTRAWTLQELLAPQKVEFFDGQWKYLGSKIENIEAIEEITSVSSYVLRQQVSAQSRSVGERMSWAADRHATRTEDIAYSLMGIFDVNMPLLYGEGPKSFERLQEEILRRSSDITTLARGQGHESHRLLGRSPADYRGLRGSRFDLTMSFYRFAITNIGLEISTKVIRWDLTTFGILLVETSGQECRLVLLVRKMAFESSFYRVGVVQTDVAAASWSREKSMMILWGTEDQKYALAAEGASPDIQHGFHVNTSDGLALIPLRTDRGFATEAITTTCVGMNRATDFTFALGDPMQPAVGVFKCQAGDTELFRIDLSFDFDGRPCCLFYKGSHTDWREVWKISESIPVPEARGKFHERRLMLAVRDEYTNLTSWFLRSCSRHKVTWSSVPREITGRDRTLYVNFSPANLYHSQGFWSFSIREDEPRFDDRGRQILANGSVFDWPSAQKLPY